MPTVLLTTLVQVALDFGFTSLLGLERDEAIGLFDERRNVYRLHRKVIHRHDTAPRRRTNHRLRPTPSNATEPCTTRLHYALSQRTIVLAGPQSLRGMRVRNCSVSIKPTQNQRRVKSFS